MVAAAGDDDDDDPAADDDDYAVCLGCRCCPFWICGVLYRVMLGEGYLTMIADGVGYRYVRFGCFLPRPVPALIPAVCSLPFALKCPPSRPVLMPTLQTDTTAQSSYGTYEDIVSFLMMGVGGIYFLLVGHRM